MAVILLRRLRQKHHKSEASLGNLENKKIKMTSLERSYLKNQNDKGLGDRVVEHWVMDQAPVPPKKDKKQTNLGPRICGLHQKHFIHKTTKEVQVQILKKTREC